MTYESVEASVNTFPTADVRARTAGIARSSKLWWLTGICLLLAFGLVWASGRKPGTSITIRFDQGHGLKVGDAVRHRGIDVGIVDGISLDQDLSGIVTNVTIDKDASALAVDGSRFWIVRPQIDIGGISGLETAVGAKYIRVMPGDSQERRRDFRGLASQPADVDDASGIEIVLRSRDRHGIHAGAPVTWRGIEIGRVLSASLSPDAAQVDIQARIDEGYRRLIRPESKFWVTSGINIDVGVTGVEVSAESLATIARGGVGMITPSSNQDDQGLDDSIAAGTVFTLHEELDEEWITSAVPINLLTTTPPSTLSVNASWKESFLGISHSSDTSSLGIVMSMGDNEVLAIFPADVAVPPADAIENTFTSTYRVGDETFEQVEQAKIRGPIAIVPYAHPLPGGRVIMKDRVRFAEAPEDCFAVRGDHGKSSMQMIGRESLSRGDDGWNVTSAGLSRSLWHGAPVIAANDEQLLGMLIVEKGGVKIVPIAPALD